MKYRYFKFFNDIARIEDDKSDLYEKEFYRDGKWVKDPKRSRQLTDAIMDYGDYSALDYKDITEEEAIKFIKEK